MSAPGFHNTITARRRGFDSITTGPVATLPDWGMARVVGELYLPSQWNSGHHDMRFTSWGLKQIGYSLVVPVEHFKEPEGRKWIAERLRHTVADYVVEAAPINMHVEGVDWR